MREAIAIEIQRYRNLQNELASSGKLRVFTVAEDIFWVQKSSQVPITHQKSFGESAKPVGVTFGAIVHGNEWGGLLVVNEVLQALVQGVLQPEIPLGFFLGNTAAALQGKRFLERDLNRSFSRIPRPPVNPTPVPTEAKRAAEIEELLRLSHFFVDFHQTIQPSLSSFFIFAYSPTALKMARALNPYLPVITHWGRPFSKEGCCSDEYTTAQGGLGITLELGGIRPTYDPMQTALGFQVALSAIAYGTQFRRPDLNLTQPEPPSPNLQGPLYTWGHTVAWPDAKYVALIPGLTNFSPIQKNQIIGTIDGQNLRAPLSGKIMFPKYLSLEEQSQPASRPGELLRILRDCRLEELP